MKWSAWFKTLQFRVLRAFILIVVLFVFWGLAFNVFDDRRVELSSILQDSQDIQSAQLSNNQNLQLFLLQGYKDSSFYRDGHQLYLDNYHQNNAELLHAMKQVQISARELSIPFENLHSLELSINGLNDSVAALGKLVLKRGYKDFGLEGELRSAVHQIEDEALLAPLEYLTLRRHEKDFINRLDWTYVDKFNRYYSDLRAERNPNGKLDSLLKSYATKFNAYAKVQRKIGLGEEQGISNSIAEMNTALKSEFELTLAEIRSDLQDLRARLNKMINGLGLIMIFLILLLSISLSRNISKDLKDFSQALREYTQNDFQSRGLFKNLNSQTLEVEEVLQDFRKMNEKLRRTMLDLRRNAKQSEHNAKVKSYFLANMSHEIRTPLNGVLGMIHLLKDTNDPAKREEFMNIIEFSAKHLGDLVNMILDFSKIDAGKMELHLQPMDLESSLSNLIEMFRFKAEENSNELSLDSALNLDSMLIADGLRLQQIMINLLSNALKFTNNGKVKLIVRELRSEHENQKRLFFAVEDTGIGIEETKLKSLFNAYSQTDRSIQKRFGGTGLGLAITYELIKMMGGELLVESKIKEGTTFSFYLDFEIGPIKAQGDINSHHQPPGLSQKVLVAEDNPVNQKVLSMLLERQGLVVSTVNNGLEAIEAFMNDDFGLILMDLQMPELDGIEATRRITRCDRYKNHPVPIVAVTANAFEEDKQEALAVGCKAFIPKPIQPEDLNTVLRRFLVLSSLSWVFGEPLG